MENLQRVCSKCGAANDMSRTQCARCGNRLVDLPASRGEKSLMRPGALDARALAVGAGVLIARAGWGLFRRVLLPRAWQVVSETMAAGARANRQPAAAQRPEDSKALTKAPQADPIPADEPDVVIKSWRVWAVKRGSTQYSGSETAEWRLKKK